jgi:two-component system response regulator
VSNASDRVALVVEGIPALARLLLGALQGEGVARSVVLTYDGVEALEYLLGRGAYAGRDLRVMPCVTLVNLSLPRLDGLELLREMRAHERTRLLPVVAFSSSAEGEREAREAYACGANSYIGGRPEFAPFEESLLHVAHYWCVLNEPPPPR